MLCEFLAKVASGGQLRVASGLDSSGHQYSRSQEPTGLLFAEERPRLVLLASWPISRASATIAKNFRAQRVTLSCLMKN
jgi:hypothetical protein